MVTEKAHTILFTEACPLDCRYCMLKNEEAYHTGLSQYEYDQILELIDKYDKETPVESGQPVRLIFTGGEPLLYFNYIKPIVEKYKNRFAYEFNTSGYPLTEEMIIFFSKYDVTFNLSVDGNERLSNYLRPNKENKYRVGYFKKLKEILPTLLYYFPKTPYKLIISPRYADLVYEMYLTAEELGFKYMTVILDFNSRDNDPKVKNPIYWDEEKLTILHDQFNLIFERIIDGFKNNIFHTQITGLNEVVQFIVAGNPTWDSQNIRCKVFSSGRSMNTLYTTTREDTYCMSMWYPDRADAEKRVQEDYAATGGKCLIDDECEAFNFCCWSCCPQVPMSNGENAFQFSMIECVLNHILYYGAQMILNVGHEQYSTSKTYLRYISQFVNNENGGTSKSQLFLNTKEA